jgi:hypothetical protein
MAAEDSFRPLLHYECLLFCCDWLGSDLRIGHFLSFCCPLANTPQLNTELSYKRSTNPAELFQGSSLLQLPENRIDHHLE